MASSTAAVGVAQVNINPLLKQLQQKPRPTATPEEIALAISNVFTGALSNTQTTILLHDLYLTGLEQDPAVLAQCATVMREAAELPDSQALRRLVAEKHVRLGSYHGGLCDIVGTGGDHHSTFNISTASSILASSLLMIAKHGNRASTSKSGSSDVLAAMRVPKQPKLEVVDPRILLQVYERTNYAFLFAPNFHKGLRNVALLRKEIWHPTIFNLLGPLSNPAEAAMEARVIGVKKTDLVPIFAEALRLNGARKAMVVCGDEDLDEISCAGPTHCARLREVLKGSGDRHVEIERFTLQPADFGFPPHPLDTVSPGKTPEANAEILTKILSGQMPKDEPVLHFVLMNAASLFVISGVCDGDKSAFGDGAATITETGPGKGRWKEGVRLARQAIQSGLSLEMLQKFAEITNEVRL